MATNSRNSLGVAGKDEMCVKTDFNMYVPIAEDVTRGWAMQFGESGGNGGWTFIVICEKCVVSHCMRVTFSLPVASGGAAGDDSALRRDVGTTGWAGSAQTADRGSSPAWLGPAATT
ncbi:hypothetical protein CBL_11841 [Carabus blaptoides fortunei]